MNDRPGSGRRKKRSGRRSPATSGALAADRDRVPRSANGAAPSPASPTVSPDGSIRMRGETIDGANGAVVPPNGTVPSGTQRSLRARLVWSLKLRVWRVLDRVRPEAPHPTVTFTPGGEGSTVHDTLVAPSYADLAVPPGMPGGPSD